MKASRMCKHSGDLRVPQLKETVMKGRLQRSLPPAGAVIAGTSLFFPYLGLLGSFS
jgi:hypothetical protein